VFALHPINVLLVELVSGVRCDAAGVMPAGQFQMPGKLEVALCFVKLSTFDYDRTVNCSSLNLWAWPPTKELASGAVSAIAAVEKKICHFEDSSLQIRCIGK